MLPPVYPVQYSTGVVKATSQNAQEHCLSPHHTETQILCFKSLQYVSQNSHLPILVPLLAGLIDQWQCKCPIVINYLHTAVTL